MSINSSLSQCSNYGVLALLRLLYRSRGNIFCAATIHVTPTGQLMKMAVFIVEDGYVIQMTLTLLVKVM